MKIEVNITKRYFFSILVTLLVLGALAIGYAYIQPIPSPGHGADTVWISANGKEQTLQQAIDNKDIVSSVRESDYCVSNSTQVGGSFSWEGWISLNVSVRGRNICSDSSGCTYKITRFSFGKNAGDDSYNGGTPSNIRQVRYNNDADEWYDSTGNNYGINGDGVGQYLDSDIWSDAAQFADDTGGLTTQFTENSPDTYVFRDNSGNNVADGSVGSAFLVTICDF